MLSESGLRGEREHGRALEELHSQLKAIFSNSNQGIYLYHDDTHRVCNKRYASLLGYGSPPEWARLRGGLLERTVAKKSQSSLISAYREAVEHYVGSTIKVVWKKKAGGEVETQVTLVPVTHRGHTFALHFISPSS